MLSPREIVAYLRGSVVHLIIVAIGVLSAWVLVSKFKSGELSFGGGSLQQKVAKKEAKVESLKEQLVAARERLAQRGEEQGKATRLADMKAELQELGEANLTAMSKLESLNKAVTETEEMFAIYRQRYRKSVRDKAIGTKMEKLTTISGRTYHQAEIKSIGALGMNITHRDGSARIPYKELPMDMQELYQFDDAEALAQKKREAERRRQLQLAQAAALAAAENDNPDPADPVRRPDRGKLSEQQQAVQNLKLTISQVRGRIKRVEAALRDERGKAVSRAPQYRLELQRLNAAKRENEARLKQLRAQMR